MTHENFKVFRLTNGQILNGQIDDFLKGKFTLKSLSLTELPLSNECLVSFGYTEDTADHEYHITTFDLGVVNHLSDKQIEKALTEAAQSVNGIICQDIAIINGNAIATFLTIKI